MPTLKAQQEFSHSPAWLKLLYYQKNIWGNYHSKVISGPFFLTTKQQQSPYDELHTFIEKLKSDPQLKCKYPARYELLTRKWPQLKTAIPCPQLSEWVETLDAGDLYLVYSSSYPNNPASMFGHTFLRFDRQKYQDKNRQGKQLLGYSMAFQAMTPIHENPVLYTLKGITGGYDAFIQIKPYYMDRGLYNNAESRDLWEYKIPLTPAQKKLFIYHLYELGHYAGMHYYFFDENCSTFLLYALNAVFPHKEFSSLNDLFVAPTVVTQEIAEQFNSLHPLYRASIKKQILAQFNQLDFKQQKVFYQYTKEDIDETMINSSQILDPLIDQWKMINYKNNTKLDPKQQKRMRALYLKRATLMDPPLSRDKQIQKENSLSALHLNPGNKKISLGKLKDYSLTYRYGYNSFSDFAQGRDTHSNFEFFSFTLNKQQNRYYLHQLTLIDVLSLEDYHWYYPQYSWRVRAKVESSDFTSSTHLYQLDLAGGISTNNSSFQLFLLPTLRLEYDSRQQTTHLYPMAQSGLKWHITTQLMALIQWDARLQNKKIKQRYKIELSYLYHQLFATMGVSKKRETKTQGLISLGLYF